MSNLYDRLKNFCSPKQPTRLDEAVRQSALTAYDETQEYQKPLSVRKKWFKTKPQQRTR